MISCATHGIQNKKLERRIPKLIVCTHLFLSTLVLFCFLLYRQLSFCNKGVITSNLVQEILMLFLLNMNARFTYVFILLFANVCCIIHSCSLRHNHLGNSYMPKSVISILTSNKITATFQKNKTKQHEYPKHAC